MRDGDGAPLFRGRLDTRGGRDDHSGGNATLRAAVLTLGAGFVADIDPDAVYVNYAGDRQPYASYFIDNSGGGFSATHNVQLAGSGGTVILLR